jgi:hypothetical protein
MLRILCLYLRLSKETYIAGLFQLSFVPLI